MEDTVDGGKKAIDSKPKRIIICCDGTAQDGYDFDGMDNGFLGLGFWRKKLYPTNVVRIARALKVTASDGTPQVVYYQPGVGTSPTERLLGGLFGYGMSRLVRMGYGFLANNYEEGDEIFLFGFSRGAFTARAICGIVCNLGLLTLKDHDGRRQHGMDSFPEVIQDYYKNITTERWEDFKTNAYQKYPIIQPKKLKVVAIGCFDTVGFQKPWFGEQLELPNTYLPPIVKYAFHALSLDEKRAPYSPTLWHIPGTNETPPDLHQVWFAGDHSDIGGSHMNHELADISLAWMVTQLKGLLEFDCDYILNACEGVYNALEPREQSPPWAGGKIHDAFDRTGWRIVLRLFPAIGVRTRTPGEYRHDRNQNSNGETREFFHHTVKVRVDAGNYNRGPITKWHHQSTAGGPVVWTRRVPVRGDALQEIREAEFKDFEVLLKNRKLASRNAGMLE